MPRAYVVAFTTRVGGVSEGPYASLNLGRTARTTRRASSRTGDSPARRSAPTRDGSRSTGSGTPTVRARGARDRAASTRDGLWTDEPGLPMLALTADCLPIALVRDRTETPAVAVLHAGGAGLLAGIVEAGVAALGARA